MCSVKRVAFQKKEIGIVLYCVWVARRHSAIYVKEINAFDDSYNKLLFCAIREFGMKRTKNRFDLFREFVCLSSIRTLCNRYRLLFPAQMKHLLYREVQSSTKNTHVRELYEPTLRNDFMCFVQ